MWYFPFLLEKEEKDGGGGIFFGKFRRWGLIVELLCENIVQSAERRKKKTKKKFKDLFMLKV